MKYRDLWKWMLACALAAVLPRAAAQQPPETHPSSAHQDIVMSWDRSAIPAEIVLWAPKTVLAYSAADPDAYGTAHLVCRSETDASEGRCPVVGWEEQAGSGGDVWLGATESRSGLRTELHAIGGVLRPHTGVSCHSQYWSSQMFTPWSSRLERCGVHQSAGIGAQLSIPASELERLVAGKWSAQLTLEMPAQAGGPSLATYTFNLDFTITDHDAVAIYFPLFNHVTPHVGLNLRYDPIAKMIGGRNELDMCLYDGQGSQAAYLGVTVRDSSGRAPGGSGYSAWHVDGGNDDSQRLDYTVTLDHNGTPVPLRNGVEEQLHGIDSARLRLVLLPGMNQPVFCVPTPLTFETPRVPVAEKRNGRYDGALQVELRVPTATP
ncbi:minor pilin and initiator protein [Stenotrophomonas maltophilia]|nr:CfaE/CblD family pilus tip adhesin [Stenotrophomonas pavanii]KOQ75496.1 minor pilin and initiator protein [Stenotrophomonas maltophilia]